MARRILSVTLLVAAAAVVLVPVAIADGGGASPGVEVLYRGVPAPGGKSRYVVVPDTSRSLLTQILLRDGSVMRVLPLPGLFGLPFVTNDGTVGGISFNGRTIVLASYGGPAPIGRTSSFAVVDVKRWRVRRTIALRGNFSFDALSPNGRMLYLIQHTSLQDYNRYRVRAYDLPYHRLLRRAIVDRRAPSERMAGQPVTRATSRDGIWAYTLYERPNGTAFIHALDTSRARAFCIDLPQRKTQSWIYRAFMRLSGDGTKLFLADRAHADPSFGAVVDTRTMRVTISTRT